MRRWSRPSRRTFGAVALSSSAQKCMRREDFIAVWRATQHNGRTAYAFSQPHEVLSTFVDDLLSFLCLQQRDVFYDLGSGIGAVPCEEDYGRLLYNIIYLVMMRLAL
jgi:hypothetical protein